MIQRFLIYGLAGWTIEIAFTGFGSMMRGMLSLTGYTYLWMLPIYGMAVFFEPIHDRIRSAPWIVRGIIWTCMILFIEYISGWLLNLLIGFCPWNYTGFSPYSVNGFMRLDFGIFWFFVGLGFEKVHDFLDSVFPGPKAPTLDRAEKS